MPRKQENIVFAMNIAASIARDRKCPHATRIRALDRFCVLAKLYDIKMQDNDPRNDGRKPEELPVTPDSADAELDRLVAERVKKYKPEGNNGR